MAEPTATDPAELAERFLRLMAAGELDACVDLLAADVLYTNVSLPSMRGRERVRQAVKRVMDRPGVGFEVYFHAIATDEAGVVLTERTDVLTYGRLRVQFWVYGRFETRDAEITVWRDSFDWLNLAAATLRGLVAVAIPGLAAKAPSGAS
jgi:limonene-1,2-epoxide hydrolase